LVQAQQISRRVLVAVTDGVLGAEIKTELERQGNTVLGPFRSVKDTIPFSLSRDLVGAIVEDWLIDGPTIQVVDALSRRGIPVGTFSTGGMVADPGSVDLAEFCRGVISFVSKQTIKLPGLNEARPQAMPANIQHPRYLGMLKEFQPSRS
jgi:hypothetical protein